MAGTCNFKHMKGNWWRLRFTNLVIFYQGSNTIDMYKTLTNFFEKLQSMGLKNYHIADVLFELRKRLIPYQYNNLPRNAKDPGKLWKELAVSL